MKNAIAIVTGASSGIGSATAKRLSQEGYSLILVGRNLERLQHTQKSLSTPSQCVSVDLTQPEAPKRILEARNSNNLKSFPLYALINNAGIIHREPFSSSNEEIWHQEFATNFFAPVRLIRELHSGIQDGGVILNVSSTLGFRPILNTSVYSASKAALNSLTQSLALEFAPRLRVLAVCPGLTDTPIHAFHGLSDNLESRQGAHLAQPMKRMGKPEDISAFISFLIGEESKWNTGALHTIDGGISLL